VSVVILALSYSEVDFGVTEGPRSKEAQVQRVKNGDSATLNSRHVVANNECSLACAVDLAGYIAGDVSWDFWVYQKIAKAMFRAAIELNIQIEWGGLWRKPKDGPHFQLSWEAYP
jgi:peptidoglycan L-alanyl-D-glutamate endopeptidase CwlK